jgi:phage terminase large subunit-like protein
MTIYGRKTLRGQEVRGLSGLVFRVQELIEQGLHAVTRYQPQADKIMRMHAQTAMIENGFVHLPKEAGWLACLRRW